MRKTTCISIISLASLLHVIVFHLGAEAFDVNAHKLLSERAVSASKLDKFLKFQLPEFPKGVIEPLVGEDAVIDLVQNGSADEDKPGVRARHHFHDPTKTWDQAGLTGYLGLGGQSSIIWGQSNSQTIGGFYSWHDARGVYLTALIGNTANYTERKLIYARLFRSIGHLIHLVQDAASPSHTRNDWHLPGDADYFHTWSEDRNLGRPKIAASGVTPFHLSILGLSPNSRAPVPIARIIDTQKYWSDTTPRATTDIGLAEYSNANFFSDDTIFSGYNYPNYGSVDVGAPEPSPIAGLKRRYYYKTRDGDVGYRVAVASTLFPILPTEFPGPRELDDFVMQDYGQRLFPRAIGYSAGLIDYFFRGKIKIEAPDRYAYSLAQYVEGNAGFFTKMRFKVSNDTSYPSTTEDTDGAGDMWAVVRYRTPTSGDVISDPFGGLSEPKYAVSAPVYATLPRALTPQQAQEVVFDFTDSPIPTNSADIFLMVVWKGKLGLENEAVMVGGKDLFEPNPLTFANATDYDCYKAKLYHVADLTAYPAYNPPTQTQRDIDSPTGPEKDGIPDIFGPSYTLSQFIKTYDPQEPKTASPNNYDFSVLEHQATLTGPQYSRFMLLHDRAPYEYSWLVSNFYDVPTEVTSAGASFRFSVPGVYNDHMVDPATGNRIRRVSLSFIYRGLPTFCIYFFVVGGPPRFEPCLEASYPYEPSFSKVEGELAPELPE